MSLSARTLSRPVYLCASLACAFTLAAGLMCTSDLYAGNRDDVGYKALVGQLGASAPNGAGVPVLMAEFGIDGGYVALQSLPQFPNKVFTVRTPRGGNSVHATEVAENFFGVANSLAPGINQVEIYETNDFLTNGYMHWATSALNPNISPQSSRVANHSWIAAAANNNLTIDHLGRLDWLVHQDDFVQVVGLNNGPSGASPIYSNSMNSIAVGLTNANHPTGTLPVGGVYTAGRSKPDLVVPHYATSFAAPVVSAASAVLIQAGHNNPGFSNGSYTLARIPNQRIYHAETSEVVKAALLAGAARTVFNSDGSTILDFRGNASQQTANGLDTRFGAGQLNVYNSYQILAGGEYNSRSDGGQQLVGPVGFDYDPSFGGAGGSNNTGIYEFIGGWTGQTLSASLVWNAKVDIDQLRTSAYKANAVTLHDMNLSLLDITNPANPVWIASSVGAIQNTENIVATLVGGHRYQMYVTASGAPFQWDYGLAWTTAGTLGWGGSAGGVWKHGDAAATNWSRGYTSVGFVNGENVVFNDAGIDSTVQISGSVAPASILVDNTNQNYSFQGGSISGPTGLIKRGWGTLGLDNNNTYTGPTIVENGWLRLDRTNALNPQGSLTVKSSGIVNLNGFDQSLGTIAGEGQIYVPTGATLSVGAGNANSEYSGIFIGSGEIAKIGSGDLTLKGTHSFDGDITVQSGRLTVAKNGVFGITTGRTIVQNGGSILLKGPVHYTAGELIELNGQGAAGFGALENVEGANTLAAHITAASGSLIRVTGGTLTLTGSLTVRPSVNLTTNGGGELAITGRLNLHSNSTVAIWHGTTVFAPTASSTVALGEIWPSLQIGGSGIVRVRAGAKDPFTDSINPSRHVVVFNEAAAGLNIEGGSVAVASINGSGRTTVNANSALSASIIRQGSLALTDATSRFSLRPNSGAWGISVLGELSMAPGSVLDLADDDLIVRATAATKNTVHADIRGKILSARNGLDGNFITKWNGSGITSSSARASNVAAGFDLLGLGVIRNSDLDITSGRPNSAYTTFGVQSVSRDDVLVKYTYVGDGNLDGVVSFDDYVGMDNAFFGLIPNLGWATGDVNFDGAINFDDYSAVDQAFFFQGAQLGGEPIAAGISTDAASLSSLAVPEPRLLAPAALVLLLIAGCLGRRRRRLPCSW